MDHKENELQKACEMEDRGKSVAINRDASKVLDWWIEGKDEGE